ncbi:MAG: hypothetical protein JW862_09810 [Anaerolineales bacterium]|nr:hypothetical protein [Anaerolineales bacterium]
MAEDFGEMVAPQAGDDKKRMWIIIAIVVLVLCCCCVALIVAGYYLGDSVIEFFEDSVLGSIFNLARFSLAA